MERKAQGMRDRSILEIVRGLIYSEVAFQEIFKKYKEGNLRFSDIGTWVDDKGQSLLYNLKEQSHSHFRDIEKGPSHKKEWLLDLAIGSIFHETMKLRENIYQLEFYRPQYLQYKLKMGKSTYEKDYLQRFERIISRAEQGVVNGMEETQSLFRDAIAQLLDLFKENAKNPFLVRFLLENQPLLKKVYGAKRGKELFNIIFNKGYLDAHQLVGRSYLQSEHYDLSSFYFSKALRIEPRHPELQFLLNFSLGMNAYYNNTYQKALSHFGKLMHLRSNPKVEPPLAFIHGLKARGFLRRRVKNEYLEKAGEVCHKISLELKDEQRLKGASKALSLAEQIRKML